MLLHFALVLHFAAIIPFCGVTGVRARRRLTLQTSLFSELCYALFFIHYSPIKNVIHNTL